MNLAKSKTFWGALVALIPAIWTFITIVFPDFKVINSDEVADASAGLVTAIGVLVVLIRKVQAARAVAKLDEPSENK